MKKVLIKRGLPKQVAKQLATMVARRSPDIEIEIALTEDQIEMAREQLRGASDRADEAVYVPRFRTESVGRLNGIEALYPENDLKELLTTALVEPMKKFDTLLIDELSRTDLIAWTKWTGAFPSALDNARRMIAASRSLLAPGNLEQFKKLLRKDTDLQLLDEFLVNLSRESLSFNK